MAKQANAELVETKERYARNRRALIERGALVGQVPTWAFTITGEEYEKQAIPTKLGEDYIPQIFQRIADGDSLATVAAWTREQGLGSGRMGARTIDRIIRNPIYRGHREFSFEGQIVTLRVEPLVDAKLWQQANDRLRNAPQGRRGPVTGRSALLTGCLFCPRCPRDGKYAPMYRLRAGRKPHGHYYYRCAGHYPERQGCGNMVDLDSTDIAVIHLLSMAQEPWKEQQLVKGENHDIELTEIRIALDDLPKRHLSDAEEDAERSRLRAERNRLESLPNIPDHWEEVDTGKTVGEHFVSLNREGRRAMLLEDVTVYAESITDPELRKVTSGPMLRIESRLFTLPVTWINEE